MPNRMLSTANSAVGAACGCPPQSNYFSSAQGALNSYSWLVDKSANVSRTQMKHELAGIRAWAYMMGMPALLVAVATPALLAAASFLPPNLIWLCYLMPV